MYEIVDTHCHLNFNSFDTDLELVLERARDNGISRILVPGVDLDSSQKAVELADRHPEIYAAIGVHPNYADTWNESSLEHLALLRKHPKVVAIGEIGLDFYREHTTPAIQQEVLISQLEFASTQHLPVILHSRQAVTTLLQILER